jgi:hypothetical protein
MMLSREDLILFCYPGVGSCSLGTWSRGCLSMARELNDEEGYLYESGLSDGEGSFILNIAL